MLLQHRTRKQHHAAFQQTNKQQSSTKRHRQWVEFYEWKFEKRFRRNAAVRGVGLAQSCVVTWLMLRQLARVAMALQAVLLAAAAR